ncbi:MULTISPECIES: DUF167 family protein [Maricaulis]|jgi:uncharacterized protein (TIGR00251 family)|uniref:UPF0235 protein Mmar10_0052 n=1 Tax=Maricaulis maris (strain MCS10) TaxID=394221 RepID=Q0ATN9_MARMM|nr:MULTISPECIES: DUF167 family protein [Maricaulis]ABI64348.1 protein of unknown function DUF167 [Maricaulis maris MCS10]MAC89815.1 hypothetical protein [Maricaulis sp.]
MISVSSDAIAVQVRLAPGASRDCLAGSQADAAERHYLVARVRAIPEKGKANAALIALLARQLGIPKRDIDVIRGATSRMKTVRISANGPEQDRIVAQLEAFADERTPD